MSAVHNKIRLSALLPAFFSFFVMGFVDVVSISVSYVKVDFSLSDKLANLLPMMVFLWFAVFSLPTSGLMGRIGRKNTVMLSAVITTAGMLIPLIHYSFPTALIAFALLGIGNTLLQVAMNPLMTDIVPQEKLTGMIILGQFIKAISSTLGPVIVGVAAGYFGNWKIIFPVYALFTALSFVWLIFVKIKEGRPSVERGSISGLFKDGYIMLLFSIIILVVGFETGLMTAVPKYLEERFSTPLEKGGFACSLYFIARTIGTFAGSFIVSRFPVKKFQIIMLVCAIVSFIGFMTLGNQQAVFVMLFLVGFTCANIFGIALGEGLRYRPDQANEISALMVTGIAGGALLPPVMGLIADMGGQFVSLFVPLAALVYILAVSFKFKCR